MSRLAALLLAAAAVTGCSKTQAKTPAAPPPLATPAPPDRVIIPAAIPEPEPPPSAGPAAATPSRPRETPAPRPERPPVAAPPQTVPAPEPPAPPPVLQTTSNPAEVEQRARALMAAAKFDLDRINPGQLTTNARAQYDTARDFVRQAENALKIKNVVLARELADKAAALANQLRR